MGGAGFEIRRGEISRLRKLAPFSPTTTQAGSPVAKGPPQRPNRGSGPPWGYPTAPHASLCAQLPPVLSMAMMSSMWPCGAAHEQTDQPLSPPSAPPDPLGWLGARELGGWPNPPFEIPTPNRRPGGAVAGDRHCSCVCNATRGPSAVPRPTHVSSMAPTTRHDRRNRPNSAAGLSRGHRLTPMPGDVKLRSAVWIGAAACVVGTRRRRRLGRSHRVVLGHHPASDGG